MMVNVVHWEEIVGKDFLPRFTEIAKAEYFSGVKDIPISTVHKKYGPEEIELYSKKRALMRYHGWYWSYLGKNSGDLKFMSIHPIRERNYVTVTQYLAAKEADRIAMDEEEYYRGEKALRRYVPNAHVDPDFVHEEDVA